MKTALFLLLLPTAWSQPLRVYSEFARIDASGRVTAPAEPREILSPAIVRNGFTSFQVVVEVPKGTPYQLYVAQNPENSVEVTLYRENGDELEEVWQPVSGNATQVFWMDVWTARDAPVQRIKVEPQLHVNNDWVIYPMEARVMEARVPETPGLDVVCDLSLTAMSTPVASRQLRNANQDGALATRLSKSELDKIRSLCVAGNYSSAQHFWTEDYLRVRDYLFRLR